MKILHVHENLAPVGGVETYLLSLMPRLRVQGHQQAFAFASGDPALADRAYQIPELKRCGWRARHAARLQMRSVLSTWRPNLVHLHNVYNVGAIDECLRMAPTVVTGHDFRYVCPASSMYYRRTEEICSRTCGMGCFTTTLRKNCLTPRPLTALRYYHRVRWMAKNWRRFGRLVTPSHAAQERFLQAGFPRERATVLPYFCPIEPLGAPRLVPERATLVFLGRLTAIKGYRYFVRALGLLPEAVTGVMIGNFTPDNERRVRELAGEAGCADRLQTRPWAKREEIGDVMRQATIVSFPSICPETLGIVGLEALACGVPVIASDVGGVREWLIPNETGLLIPPKDPRALATAAWQLLASPERAQTMGTAGIRLMRERFSPENHVDRLLAIYEDVAGSGKAGPVPTAMMTPAGASSP